MWSASWSQAAGEIIREHRPPLPAIRGRHVATDRARGTGTTVIVDDELEPLDPDSDWNDDSQQEAEPAPVEGERTAASSSGAGNRRRGAAVAVLVVIAAGLTVWGVLGHHRHRAHQATGPIPLTTATARERATALVNELARQHDNAVAAQFAPNLSAHLDALLLKAEWDRVLTAYGAVRGSAPATVPGDGPLGFTVAVPVDLARGGVVVEVTLLSSGSVTAFGLEPSQVPDPPSLTPAYVEPRASAVVHDLATGADAAVVGQLDPLTRADTTADQLQWLWSDFEAAYGNFVSEGPATVLPARTDFVDVPVHWARATSTILVGFDWNGQAGALVLLRPDAPAGASDLSPLPLTPRASEVATTVCRELAGQEYASVTQRFDPLAAAANAQPPLQTSWEHVVAKLGTLRAVGTPAVIADAGDEILYEVALTFGHGQAHVQVGVDNNLQIQILLILAGPPTRTPGR